MTKITDLPGAKEAFNKFDLTPVHLEVDVEAMEKIIIEHCKVNSLLYDGVKNLSKTLSYNIPQWARLVRK